MKKCHRCKINDVEIGVNVFDTVTGQHIITRRYCKFCAGTIGLIAQ